MDIKNRRKKTKNYDLISLAIDLGFTPIKISKRFYTLEEHDSVMINIDYNTFRQYSTGAYGDPVAFCMSLGVERDVRFKNLGYSIQYLEDKIMKNPDRRINMNTFKKNSVKSNIVIPEADNDNRKIYYYMKNRCIDKKIVDEFINNKWLFQERKHHNLVFVSYKKDKPVFITEKGIIKEQKFMKEYAGNDYDHCFFVDYGSDTLVVTEAIIDMMSLMTLDIEHFQESSYLSINSTTKDNAIYKQLLDHPEIKKVKLRLDHDEAGMNATARIQDRLLKEFPQIGIDVDYPPEEKDWNDYLIYAVNEKEKMNEYTIIF